MQISGRTFVMRLCGVLAHAGWIVPKAVRWETKVAILRIGGVVSGEKAAFAPRSARKSVFCLSQVLINATFVAKTSDIGVGSLQLHVVDEVDELLLTMDVQFTVDVADVSFRRALGDVQLLLDVRRLVAAGQVVHHFVLAA